MILTLFLSINLSLFAGESMFSHLITSIQNNPNEKLHVVAEKIGELENEYYTYNFKVILDFDPKTEIESTFFKILKIKAKKADLFAKNLLTCDFLYDTPSGFMRKVTQAGENPEKTDEIIERVLIDETNKSILFIQETTTGKTRLAAINKVEKENDNYYFKGKYVFEILKDSQNFRDKEAILTLAEKLPIFSEIMIHNLISFYKKENVNEIYYSYYRT